MHSCWCGQLNRRWRLTAHLSRSIIASVRVCPICTFISCRDGGKTVSRAFFGHVIHTRAKLKQMKCKLLSETLWQGLLTNDQRKLCVFRSTFANKTVCSPAQRNINHSSKIKHAKN